MNQKSISISYREYTSNEGLDSRDMELLDRAQLAAGGSYAPYSNFNVGAAVRLSNGEIVAASNQENAAYPSGLCAERVAIFYAHARFPEASVEAIAVTASVDGHICEGILTAHHLIYRSEIYELRKELSNGVALCRRFHDILHEDTNYEKAVWEYFAEARRSDAEYLYDYLNKWYADDNE